MKRENSFDFIRFIAAAMVVFSHSFALVGLNEPLIGSNTFGGLGVWIFFILSGYLIIASWEQYPRLNVFLAKRSLRIFPGLLVAILFSVLVVGLLYTSLNTWDYLTHTSTITYLNNILLYNTQFSLPGVFENNPFPNSVNGSLWTLAYEFTMYLTVAALGVLKIYKKIDIKYIWVGLLILQAVVLVVGADKFDFSVFYIRLDRIITLSLMFMTGVLFYKKSKKIKLSTKYGLVALLAFLLTCWLAPSSTVFAAATLLAYALFALGSSPLMSKFGKYGDFSYGIYIYSFPVQQIIAATIQPSSPYVMFLLALPISVVLGALSWRFIESQALKLKSKIDLGRYPIKQADEAW